MASPGPTDQADWSVLDAQEFGVADDRRDAGPSGAVLVPDDQAVPLSPGFSTWSLACRLVSGLARAVERALGRIDGVVGDGGADGVDLQAERGDLAARSIWMRTAGFCARR